MRRSCLYFFLLIVPFYLHLACASYRILESPLDQNSQKFLDITRYIITLQEDKIFREMPPEDRGEFVTDFWKRRDPTPETEVNEFRQQYYTRLAIADKAFRTGIPGWMTDKGRIFILLGPPTDVIKKSMGDATVEPQAGVRELSADLLEEGTRTERPTEIWVYNQYPDYFAGPLRLVFVDYESNGDYKLTTDVEVKPFSMMTYIQSDPSLQKYQWIGEIEKDGYIPAILPFLYYSKSIGKIEKDKKENYTVECSFEIPLGTLRFREEDGQYEYHIELSIKVVNMETKGSCQEKKEMRKSLSLENLRESIKEGYSLSEMIKVPLEKGTNKIYFSLRDNIQQKRLRKLDIVKIKQ
jgi:GWxTD domain-containing protein